MTGLLDVFSSWFRSFGYATSLDANLAGASGAHHLVPLLVERDSRRIPVFAWIRQEPLDPSLLEPILACVRDCACEQGLVVSLGPAGENVRRAFQNEGVAVWDARRVVEELGEAVLSETVPEVWPRTDPLQPRRPSIVKERIHEAPAPAPAPVAAHPPPPVPHATVQVTLPPTNDAIAEAPFPAPVPPLLATPAEAPKAELQVPAAFGIFDAPSVAPSAPTPAPPLPAAPVPRGGKQVLRSQVSRQLAASICARKLRSADKVFLRLSPFHVYDYEAHLLVDGSLDAETRKGRIGIDAVQKKVLDWNVPLDTAPVNAEGADIDEKRIRVDTAEAERVAKHELVQTVTRDVVLEEDSDEWAVVVKKKVTLGPDDVKLQPLGTFWLPVWRVSGRDGAMEIDAATGAIVFEEILKEKTDAQLI